MKVLIADDDAEARQALEKMLRRANYDVLTARDGADAVELYVLQRPSLVVLDIDMPRLDGYQTARCIRAIGQATVQIVFLSGECSRQAAVRAAAAGGDAYLSKPASVADVLEQLSALNRPDADAR